MTLLEYYESKRPRSYETSWHHRWICETVERGYRERKNLIIEVPPRGGKSEIVNAYAPGWWLEDHFDAMFGLVTNSDNLAKKFSVACRQLITHPLEVDRDSQWKVKGLESLNFSYLASGVRGQLTGHGFDTVCFDDLLKSGMEAKSQTVRDSVWENVVSAALNRLSPQGIIIAMQARLHEDDPVGRLLKLEHLNFLHLHLPATNDSGQEAWFRDGYSGETVLFPAYEALWSTRFGREKLDEIKSTVSSYYWMAQYQQVPSLGADTYFDLSRCPRYQLPNVNFWWVACDFANTATANGSRSALVAVGYDESTGGFKVIGCEAGRWRQDEMGDQLLAFCGAMFRLTGTNPTAVIVERAAGGYGILDQLRNELPLIPIIPKGSKEIRAGEVCFLVNRGSVQLPESAAWLSNFEQEVGGFPLASLSDITDSLVHALKFVVSQHEFQEGLHAGLVYVSEEQRLQELKDEWELQQECQISSDLDDVF